MDLEMHLILSLDSKEGEEMKKLLEIKNLNVSFHTYAGEVKAVRGVNLSLNEGETLAIVGESGSGKTVTSKAIMGLIATPPGEIKAGSEILFEGIDILKNSPKKWQNFRGQDAGMIFQDPMTSLNPTMKIGKQIAEGILKHEKITKKEAMEKTLQLLKAVNIPNPEQRMNQYPYEFSGGMRQRVVIAIALACNPKLMIADEPTTALDVTIQAQILELLKEIQRKNHTSIIMITHDLGVVAGIADKVAVMYAGDIMEQGRLEDIFEHPLHPYTHALMNTIPRLDTDNQSKLQVIAGTPPDLIAPPKGCGFADRCEFCMEICQEVEPPVYNMENQHKVKCWLHHEMAKTKYGYEDIRSVFNHE